MRVRLLAALMVSGVLSMSGVASAQSTSTDPTSSYTTTTPTATQVKPTTAASTKPTTSGNEESGAVPSVAAQPAGSAPSKLAFTGAEPLGLIGFGVALSGAAAALLVRDRRRISRDR